MRANRIGSRLALPVFLVLAGCGGSGGSSAPPDTTPDAFSFAPLTDVPTGAPVESAVTVRGINAAAPISVAGGTYSINSGAFTSASGTVSSGQTVRLRVDASADFETTVEATLTIGGVSAVFSVTTYALDATPEPFSFTDQTDVVRSAAVESGEIEVAGINVPVTIGVAGGAYAIDGGSFESGEGTVENGQTVRLQVDASADPGETVEATLTIGEVSAVFAVTTSSDVTPPIVSILFPPGQARTAGGEVVVRGTASDDSGTIEVLRVNGVDATTSDGYAHWVATVPLAPGVNPVIVEAVDPYLNDDPAAAQVGVTRHARFVLPYSVALDAANDRALVMDTESASMVAVDLDTGSRSVLSNNDTPGIPTPFQLAYNVVLDEARGRALVYDPSWPSVVAVDLTTGQRSTVSDRNTPNDANLFLSGRDIVVDAGRDRLLVLTSTGSIIAVDLATGARSVLSDASTPNTDHPLTDAWAITIDAANDRALVTRFNADAVYAVDLASGARSILSSNAPPNDAHPISFAPAIAVDAPRNRALVIEPSYESIYAVDLTTGIRSVFSGPANPDAVNSFSYPWAFAMEAARDRVLVLDQDLRALMAVDLQTGARAFVSRDEPEDAVALLVEPRGIAFDSANGRLLVADYAEGAIVAMDLATAERAVVSDGTTPNADSPFSKPRALQLDTLSATVFVLDDGPQVNEPAAILAMDLATGGRTILTDGDTPDASLPLSRPFDMALDPGNHRLLVTEQDDPAVIGVDLTTGARTLIASNSVPNADNPLTKPQGIAIDAARNRAIVSNSQTSPSSSVLAVDLDTGARSVVSSVSTPDATDVFIDPALLAMDAGNDRAFVADRLRRQLLQLDLATGARIVVSGDTEGAGDNPIGFSAAGVAYDPDRDVAFVVDENAAAILAVDIVTGQRVYVLR